MRFGLCYFAGDSHERRTNRYDLLLEGDRSVVAPPHHPLRIAEYRTAYAAHGPAGGTGRFRPEEIDYLAEQLFDRYVTHGGLVDFGLPAQALLDGLSPLDELRAACAAEEGAELAELR